MTDIRTPWRAVSAMFVLNGALFGIWASRIPAIAARHDLEPGALGLLLLLLAGGAIVAFPLAGRAADSLGAQRVTLGIAVAYAIALILLAPAPTVALLAIALFLFGATHGAMDVTMNVWAGEVERRMGRPVMSSFHAMFSLGAGLGAGSGYLAVSAGLGLLPHFLIASITIAAVTLWLANIAWTPDETPRSTAPAFALPRGPLIVVGVVAFCSALGEGAMADWSAIFLVRTTGATEDFATLGYAVFSVAMVVMRFLGGPAIGALGPVTAARIAGATAVTGVLLAVGVATFPAALAGFALMGLGYAVIMPLAFSRAANDPDVPPGAAIARVSTLGYGGMLLGPPLIGFAAELTSIRAAFLILACLAAVICVLAPVLRPGARGAAD